MGDGGGVAGPLARMGMADDGSVMRAREQVGRQSQNLTKPRKRHRVTWPALDRGSARPG